MKNRSIKSILSFALVAVMLFSSLPMYVHDIKAAGIVPQASEEQTTEKTGTGFVAANAVANYSSTTEFYITSVADFEAFAQDTYKAGHDYYGKTVYLTADIDISTASDGKATQICGAHVNASGSSGNNTNLWGFSGTFDGQGYAIKNFKAKTPPNGAFESFAGGIFRRIWSYDDTHYARVRNLVIDNFTSSTSNCTQNWFAQGVIADQILRGAVIENCTIKNSTLTVNSSGNSEAATGFICGRFFTEAQGGYGTGAGRSDPSPYNPTLLKVINTSIDSTNKITVSSGSAAGRGGLIGYMQSSSNADIVEIELTGSAINPTGATGPIGLLFNSLPKGFNLYSDGAKVYSITSSLTTGNLSTINTKISDAAHDCYGVTAKPAYYSTFDIAGNYENTSVFTLSTVADLENFAKDTYKAGHSYYGKTVKLANDIVVNDTSASDWYNNSLTRMTSINGAHADVTASPQSADNDKLWGFAGTFDGQGHAIKGWYGQNGHSGQPGYSGALFTRLNGDSDKPVTVKNLTIDGFYSVRYSSGSWAYQGVLADQIIKGGNITNVTIKNAVVNVSHETNNTNYYTGMLAGAYYSDGGKKTYYNNGTGLNGDGSTPTDYWLNLTCVSIEPSCKLVYSTTPNTNSRLGGLFGVMWGQNVSSNLSITSSSIRFENYGTYYPVKALDSKNNKAFALKIDGGTSTSYASSTSFPSNDFNTSIENSNCYGTKSETHLHVAKTIPEKPATCYSTGNAAGTGCTNCDALISGGEPIAKLPHDYSIAHEYAAGKKRCYYCYTSENTFNRDDYANTKTFVISTLADLEAFSADSRVHAHDYYGKKVILANDIIVNDISVDEWWEKNPKIIDQIYCVADGYDSGNTLRSWGFAGTFDGQGFRLVGLYTQRNADSDAENMGAGLFRRLNGTLEGAAQIKNLTIDGYYSNNDGTHHNVQGTTNGLLWNGAFVDQVINGATIENCHLRNARFELNNDQRGADTGAFIGSAYTDNGIRNVYSDEQGISTKDRFDLKIIHCTLDQAETTTQTFLVPRDKTDSSYGAMAQAVGGIIGNIWTTTSPSLYFNIELSNSAIKPTANTTRISLSPIGDYEHIVNSTPVDTSTFTNVKVFVGGEQKYEGKNISDINSNLSSGGWNSESPVNPHTCSYTSVAAIPATCTRDGVTEGSKCLACGKIQSGCQKIFAEHQYNDSGVCSSCNANVGTATGAGGSITSSTTASAVQTMFGGASAATVSGSGGNFTVTLQGPVVKLSPITVASGCSLTILNANGKDCVIKAASSGTTLFSGAGTITFGNGTNAGSLTIDGAGSAAIVSSSGGTVNMYDGVTLKNVNKEAAGVRITDSATFNMYGGMIRNMSGGAVYVNNGACKVNLNGGEITQCTAAHGAAIRFYKTGEGTTLTIENTRIRHNTTTTANSGAIYVDGDAGQVDINIKAGGVVANNTQTAGTNSLEGDICFASNVTGSSLVVNGGTVGKIGSAATYANADIEISSGSSVGEVNFLLTGSTYNTKYYPDSSYVIGSQSTTSLVGVIIPIAVSREGDVEVEVKVYEFVDDCAVVRGTTYADLTTTGQKNGNADLTVQLTKGRDYFIEVKSPGMTKYYTVEVPSGTSSSTLTAERFGGAGRVFSSTTSIINEERSAELRPVGTKNNYADGTVEYGWSFYDDINTVTNWQQSTIFDKLVGDVYFFARISDTDWRLQPSGGYLLHYSSGTADINPAADKEVFEFAVDNATMTGTKGEIWTELTSGTSNPVTDLQFNDSYTVSIDLTGSYFTHYHSIVFSKTLPKGTRLVLIDFSNSTAENKVYNAYYYTVGSDGVSSVPADQFKKAGSGGDETQEYFAVYGKLQLCVIPPKSASGSGNVDVSLKYTKKVTSGETKSNVLTVTTTAPGTLTVGDVNTSQKGSASASVTVGNLTDNSVLAVKIDGTTLPSGTVFTLGGKTPIKVTQNYVFFDAESGTFSASELPGGTNYGLTFYLCEPDAVADKAYPMNDVAKTVAKTGVSVTAKPAKQTLFVSCEDRVKLNTEKLVLNISGNSGDVTYKVYSVSGTTATEKTLNATVSGTTYTFTLTDLAPGAYMVLFECENGASNRVTFIVTDDENLAGSAGGLLGQHTHSFVVQNAIDATFVESGTQDTYYKSCACGEISTTETFTTTHTRHVFNKNTVSDAALKSTATFYDPAVYYKTCAYCSAISDTETFTNGSRLTFKYLISDQMDSDLTVDPKYGRMHLYTINSDDPSVNTDAPTITKNKTYTGYKTNENKDENAYASGLKVRTYKGNEVLLYTREYRGVVMRYPDKTGEKGIFDIYDTRYANGHSVELVPCGNDNYVVAAAFSGGNVVFYNAAAGTNETNATNWSVAFDMYDAHGVLYDPDTELVFAIGGTELRAYKVVFNANAAPTVTLQYTVYMDSSTGALEGTTGAHDIQPVYGNTDRLWVTTHNNVYQYSVSEKKFYTDYDGAEYLLNFVDVKGIGNFDDGSIVYVAADSTWTYGWTTPTVVFLLKTGNGYKEYSLRDETVSIYKIRVYNPAYQ